MDKCSYNPNQAQNQGHDANRTHGEQSPRRDEQHKGNPGAQRDRQSGQSIRNPQKK